MSRTTRWAVVVFVCLAPLAGFAYAFPEWTAEAGLDVWAVPEIQADAERDQRRSDDLDARLRSSAERLALKNEIALEVIAGRLNLRAAARRYRELNAAVPGIASLIRYRHPACGDDEVHVRNVLDTVRWKAERQAGGEEVMARLNAELVLLRDESGGEVRLGE